MAGGQHIMVDHIDTHPPTYTYPYTNTNTHLDQLSRCIKLSKCAC